MHAEMNDIPRDNARIFSHDGLSLLKSFMTSTKNKKYFKRM